MMVKATSKALEIGSIYHVLDFAQLHSGVQTL